MKVMVIGSGGREHAIAWKFAQENDVERVFVAPGNGGTGLERKCQNVALGADPSTEGGAEACLASARKIGIDLVVIGPEAPLASGLADRLRAEGISVVGPGAPAARLESSKSFAKDFMVRHGVRAASSATFTSYEDARDYALNRAYPLVVKADGLAAGKGVVVAEDFDSADKALKSFMAEGSLGDAGATVVVEDFLSGVEVSVLAAVSVYPGAATPAILPFVAARDHKRRFEGAAGPNTGGMGAIAPVPDFGPQAEADFRAHILEPTLRGLLAEGMDYRGFIFFGLMVDGDRCSLLEYNVRLGDPETQAVLPLMETPLTGLCRAILDGNLGTYPLGWKAAHSCAPVAVAKGYPGSYPKGDPISIDHAALVATGAKLFHAGTSLDQDGLACGLGPGATEAGVLRTAGGRVLASSAVAPSAELARQKAYAGLDAVSFDGMGYRRDIGTEIPDSRS